MDNSNNLHLLKKEGEAIASKVYTYFIALRDHIIRRSKIMRLKMDVREYNKEKNMIINELGNELYKLKSSGKVNLPEFDDHFNELDKIHGDIQKTNETIHKLILQ